MGFDKVMVANRGEIAVRIFRTLRELGLGCVAVYSDADRGRQHAEVADEAYRIGPGPAAESYLLVDVLVETALRSGAGAVHPGYGFLAENAVFAQAVEDAGLVWIGPPPSAIELMGSKTAARTAMREAGVPIIPGATKPVESVDEILALGAEVGYPLIVKAAAGGGGKGMKLVEAPEEAEKAYESAQREGLKFFADASVYVERYLVDPRHVEVQVLADGHGNVIHLGERDCTIQRRHQKLIEETPSPGVSDELRARIGQIGVDAARAAGYRSAGTIEGLLTAEGQYYFMEMNTRIQVEHTVTEEVTGLDLVREQVMVALGHPLSVTQEQVQLRGHAFECRINAEDVAAGFLPAPGLITAYHEPSGPGVRVDSGVRAGDEISGLYDPMIAKLIVRDTNRETARKRMLRALEEFVIGGPPTLIGFHRAMLQHPGFIAGETCHGAAESEEIAAQATAYEQELAAKAAALTTASGNGAASRAVDRLVAVEVDGRSFDVRLHVPEAPWAESARRHAEREQGLSSGAGGAIVSPMQGTVLKVGVEIGQEVHPGHVVAIVEAMKMENEVVAHAAGVVDSVSVAVGQGVSNGQVICVVTTDGAIPE
ncbi:MAG: acetyl-CoA carboxylase biotin carboxylase subunit [Actinobacteria bacterium]|nr:acetyl-CoA carboxylase biotin carboxylase subunit [Actinomycetota bacterium]